MRIGTASCCPRGTPPPACTRRWRSGGFFPEEDLLTLRQIGSHLQGHPNMNLTPGVDMSTGSLGQGVSAAAGMALAAKYQGKDCRVYTLLGDGEIQEGEVWEAFMFAHHYKLDNLCVIIDNNGLQIDGKVGRGDEPLPHSREAEGLRVRGEGDRRPRLRSDRGGPSPRPRPPRASPSPL